MSSSKTRDFPVEMTEEQREAIVYRSKLLNKYFESYDDMLKEEAEFKKQNEEKLKQQEEKKNRALEIQKAKEHLIEVRKQASDMIKEADKKYNDLVNKFIEDYHSYHESTYENNGKSVVTIGDVLDTFFHW